MIVNEITTSSTHTASGNECKHTCCLFSTKPHPVVPAVHSTNQRRLTHYHCSITRSKIVHAWGRHALLRLHAYYVRRTPIARSSSSAHAAIQTYALFVQDQHDDTLRCSILCFIGQQNGAWRWNYDIILRRSNTNNNTFKCKRAHSNYYKRKRTRCSCRAGKHNSSRSIHSTNHHKTAPDPIVPAKTMHEGDMHYHDFMHAT